MKDLRSLKNRYKLVFHTSFSSEIYNNTRRGSKLKMLSSFVDIHRFLSMCAFSDKTIDLIPNAIQKRQVESLIKILYQIEVVNKDFQKCDASKITLSYVRTCFAGLIEDFPDLSSHLAANADVVAFPNFENAIVKIQRGNESNLNNHERRAVSQFLKNAPDQASSRNEERKEESELSFIDRMRLKDSQ